jgi:hypothetical protein
MGRAWGNAPFLSASFGTPTGEDQVSCGGGTSLACCRCAALQAAHVGVPVHQAGDDWGEYAQASLVFYLGVDDVDFVARHAGVEAQGVDGSGAVRYDVDSGLERDS